MKYLLTIAYFLAMANFVPLLMLSKNCDARVKRGPLGFLMLISAALAAYEVFMTFIWSPSVVAPIRLDILMLMIPLGIINFLFGLWYLLRSRATDLVPEQKRLMRSIAAWCLAVPLLASFGLVGSVNDQSKQTQLFDEGRLFRFEARLRDAPTQRRFFGTLSSEKNSIAGYYISDNKDDRFSRMIINEDLDIWLFSFSLYERHGKLKRIDNNTYEWTNQNKFESPFEFKISQYDDGDIRFSGDYGSNPTITSIQFHKTIAPHFPWKSGVNNAVQFLGVFSAKTDEFGKSIGVYHLWLWRSKNKIWGHYDRRFVEPNSVLDFVSTQEIELVCVTSCDQLDLRFRLNHGNVRLKQLTTDTWSIKDEDNPNNPTYQLRRGQIIPGHVLDLAPLSSIEENKHWLEAVTAGHFIQWQVPEKIEFLEF